MFFHFKQFGLTISLFSYLCDVRSVSVPISVLPESEGVAGYLGSELDARLRLFGFGCPTEQDLIEGEIELLLSDFPVKHYQSVGMSWYSFYKDEKVRKTQRILKSGVKLSPVLVRPDLKYPRTSDRRRGHRGLVAPEESESN